MLSEQIMHNCALAGAGWCGEDYDFAVHLHIELLPRLVCGGGFALKNWSGWDALASHRFKNDFKVCAKIVKFAGFIVTAFVAVA